MKELLLVLVLVALGAFAARTSGRSEHEGRPRPHVTHGRADQRAVGQRGRSRSAAARARDGGICSFRPEWPPGPETRCCRDVRLALPISATVVPRSK
jgi:hypothetical protein